MALPFDDQRLDQIDERACPLCVLKENLAYADQLGRRLELGPYMRDVYQAEVTMVRLMFTSPSIWVQAAARNWFLEAAEAMKEQYRLGPNRQARRACRPAELFA